MNKEISALEEVENWDVMLRKNLPEGVNVLPSTWYFNIKRYPGGRFLKFKARFCVRGDYQQKVVDYREYYYPLLGWSTVRSLV